MEKNEGRTLKSENLMIYAQKPQRNCTFMKAGYAPEPEPEINSYSKYVQLYKYKICTIVQVQNPASILEIHL